MKTKLFFLGMLLWGLSMLGQTEKEGQLFKLKATLKANYLKKLKNVSNDGKTHLNSAVYVEENVLYKVQSINKDTVTFYAVEFDELDNTDKDKNTNKDKAYYYNDKLFEIDLANYKSYASDNEVADRMTFGVLTLPFKYRLQKGANFENKFNLNTVLSYLLSNRFNQNIKLYFQGGAGFGAVNLNSDNATGVIAGSTENIETITGFGGLMVDYKGFQTGVYLGADKINNNSKYNWQSQGKPWLSIGIGFKVFTISKLSENNKNQ
jgi:hypothetical protein